MWPNELLARCPAHGPESLGSKPLKLQWCALRSGDAGRYADVIARSNEASTFADLVKFLLMVRKKVKDPQARPQAPLQLGIYSPYHDFLFCGRGALCCLSGAWCSGQLYPAGTSGSCVWDNAEQQHH